MTGRYRLIVEYHATDGVARLCRVLAVKRPLLVRNQAVQGKQGDLDNTGHEDGREEPPLLQSFDASRAP